MEKEKVLLDNRNIDYNIWYESYVEYCNDFNKEVFSDNSEDFFNWLNKSLNDEFDDFISNLEYSDENVECIVLGSLGLWYGRVEVQKRFNTLKDAIYACLSECDYYTITEENGIINVLSSHHDGTNSFSIYKLNKRAERVNDDNIEKLSNTYYHSIFNIDF
jgi:hypothetical protein